VRAGRRPPRFPLEGPEASPLETLGLVAVGGVLALGVLVWLAGEVSGRVFGGAWPGLGIGEMGGVVAQLPRHAGDPAAAWPAGTRGRIPGPLEFYATLAVLMLPIAGVGYLFLQRRSRPSSRDDVTARWAGSRDLRSLFVRSPRTGRLTLGRVDGQLVAAEARQSVIVVGPVQTGKTSGFAIPAILEWQGPVVATSVKTDLLRETLKARDAIPGAKVWVYDPTGSTGVPTAFWNPLDSCSTWQGAQRVAAWLVTAARPVHAGIESADFWYTAAARLLAPILFAAASEGATMAEVVRWIETQDRNDVREAIDRGGEPAAETSFDSFTNMDDRTRSGIYATTGTVLNAYADPDVLRSALSSGLDAERLLDGGSHTAYLCAPAHEQRRLQPLFSTLVQEIVAAAYERGTAAPLDPPLLLVLDECANIAPLRDLATLAATGAGQGIQLVSVFQDMAQITTVYGRDQAPTIVTNHRAKVILSGSADSTTFDYVARLLGDEEVRQVASTVGEGSRSKTESVAYRSLVPANVLREMEPGEGLLVYGHLPPARITLRPWYEDRQLRALARARSAELVGEARYRA
jgi:type IV secretion system protein VirD4